MREEVREEVGGWWGDHAAGDSDTLLWWGQCVMSRLRGEQRHFGLVTKL